MEPSEHFATQSELEEALKELAYAKQRISVLEIHINYIYECFKLDLESKASIVSGLSDLHRRNVKETLFESITLPKQRMLEELNHDEIKKERIEQNRFARTLSEISRIVSQ